MSRNHEAKAVQLVLELGHETPRASAIPATPGARLRLARRGRGISQQKLGRRMRRSRDTVARWERSGIPARQVRPVAEIVRVSRSWLGAGVSPDRTPGDSTPVSGCRGKSGSSSPRGPAPATGSSLSCRATRTPASERRPARRSRDSVFCWSARGATGERGGGVAAALRPRLADRGPASRVRPPAATHLHRMTTRSARPRWNADSSPASGKRARSRR